MEADYAVLLKSGCAFSSRSPSLGQIIDCSFFTASSGSSIRSDHRAMSEYVNDKCLRVGMSREESVQAYNEMAPDFNEYVGGIKYIAPEKAADLTSELFPDKSKEKILDLACGTGLVAEAVSFVKKKKY
ncbi:uncharacterized protein LOC118477430 [Aplysia californica]|uniref:Uncharacterized protein LOC118477430 n=1 Tax=Aplysia californica TaxID=6500 RepID=A0ABM1VQT9_APLCA|nr:uncharacterized protein LOC118477430 [Aplysia californica]